MTKLSRCFEKNLSLRSRIDFINKKIRATRSESLRTFPTGRLTPWLPLLSSQNHLFTQPPQINQFQIINRQMQHQLVHINQARASKTRGRSSRFHVLLGREIDTPAARLSAAIPIAAEGDRSRGSPPPPLTPRY